MNKLITILIVVCLMGLASAGTFAINTIITQAEFNEIDFVKEDINPTQWKVTLDNGILVFDINYDTYVSSGGTDWVSTVATKQLSYDLERYSACRASGKTILVCKETIMNNVRTQWDYYETDYRTFMEKQKEDDFTGEIDPKDFNIF